MISVNCQKGFLRLIHCEDFRAKLELKLQLLFLEAKSGLKGGVSRD